MNRDEGYKNNYECFVQVQGDSSGTNYSKNTFHMGRGAEGDYTPLQPPLLGKKNKVRTRNNVTFGQKTNVPLISLVTFLFKLCQHIYRAFRNRVKSYRITKGLYQKKLDKIKPKIFIAL